MKTLITAAALVVLLSTAAHATQLAPGQQWSREITSALPKAIQGLWCEQDDNNTYRRDPCKNSGEGPMIIKPYGIGGLEHWCKLQSYHLTQTDWINIKVRCRTSDGTSKWSVEYAIRLEHNGTLSLQVFD